MKQSLTRMAILGGVLLAMGTGGDLLACGDKLVVVGRGLRANRVRGVQRASILLYADPKGELAAALEQGHLRQDLERAGHRLRSAATKEDLEAALSTGTYDLLLADYKATALAESESKGSASKPTVLPTLYNPSDAELAAASHQYNCIMKAPGEQKDYMAVISEALAERAKQTPAGSKK